MRVFQSLREFERAAGTRLGHGEWFEVAQDRIDRFADATGDRQWIHVDPRRAEAGPFGTTIAHGFLTLSLIPALTEGIVRVAGLAAAVNYGCGKVRFPAPLPVGSRIRAGVDLVSVDSTTAGALSTTRVTVEREGSGKPVCVADTLTLLVP
ncbi:MULTISPECIES: MaoC family dehydratase [Amycolatopsis]|uniref:Acyl dehydratase n=2 Tax=Amycolatopsis TaxID=1813 RepID=A0A1I3WLF7_9PSEU|nr:MaoC family dehydratase [Amycolatopsis sacchari]SFK07281.1 Acyl dehydratase [Amycolatopsis sacchari]